MPLPPDEKKLKTIAQAAAELGLLAYILRYWETKFKHVQPFKSAGGHRYYSEEAVQSLRQIHHLLYEKNFTIKGAQQYLNELQSGKPNTGDNADIVVAAAVVAEPVAADIKSDRLPDDLVEKLNGLLDQLKSIQDEISEF
ncbi:MAG: MerR family transcriptional regulator [Alphaproteobacteria bacterium]|nr:MerR family transcriptional regulator [Alphaproteobacteria bacterium]